MMHENLPYRINQLNMRGLGTVIRRLISATILIAFIIFSFSVIIFATALHERHAPPGRHVAKVGEIR